MVKRALSRDPCAGDIAPDQPAAYRMVHSKRSPLVDALDASRNADGWWAYYRGKTSRIGPACWAALYLSRAEMSQRDAVGGGARWLASCQRADEFPDDATGGSRCDAFRRSGSTGYGPSSAEWRTRAGRHRHDHDRRQAQSAHGLDRGHLQVIASAVLIEFLVARGRRLAHTIVFNTTYAIAIAALAVAMRPILARLPPDSASQEAPFAQTGLAASLRSW